MKITRIELAGPKGSVTIQRDGTTIRIDSFLRDPQRGQAAWLTWEFTRADEKTLWTWARQIQERAEGFAGTNGDIDGYYRELVRFQD